MGSLRRYSAQAAFAGTAAVLALAAALLAGAGWWAYREFAEQGEHYRTYRALQRDAGKADSLSATYAGLLKDMSDIRKALPAQNQGSQVLNALVDGAKRMDLGLAGITALDEVPFPGFIELPFELGLSGTFPNLVRYLHALETQGMMLQVRHLTTTSEAMNRARVQAKLELSVFVPSGARRVGNTAITGNGSVTGGSSAGEAGASASGASTPNESSGGASATGHKTPSLESAP